MASLTIRKLDEHVKTYLRLRSARNRRSVEEEVRVILRELIEGRERAADAVCGAARGIRCGRVARTSARPRGQRHPDYRRRHRGLQGARPDPAAAGSGPPGALHPDLCCAAIYHPADRATGALCGQSGLSPTCSIRDSEFDVGHIRLARDCDLVVVAPATADLMAKMAGGHADDLATAVLLATGKPFILLAPAINPLMWRHAATQRNRALLAARRRAFQIGPNAGAMAERGEAGVGRMAKAIEIADGRRAPAAAAGAAAARRQARAGHQRADPRGDRSGALHQQSLVRQARPRHLRGGVPARLAETILVAGPPAEPDSARRAGAWPRSRPAGDARCPCRAALPVDVAVCAAAVTDSAAGREPAPQKLKKTPGESIPPLRLRETPRIYWRRCRGPPVLNRPALVIGFASETENLLLTPPPSWRPRAATGSSPTPPHRTARCSAAMTTASPW